MKPPTETEGSAATLEASPAPAQATAAPRGPVKAAPVRREWAEDDDEPKGFKKYRPMIIVGVLGLGALIGAKQMFAKAANAPVAAVEPQTVRIVLPPPSTPPPPPPPPPQEVQKQEEKMVEEEKQDEAPDPTPQVETALKAPGGGGGMVLKSGNGWGVFTNRNTVNTEKMKWSAYASQAQARIADALRTNPKTRKAAMRIDVRVWPDSTGRITRATLGSSTGDSALDATIREEVLSGLQLSQPPPEGMPTPIVMRVTARRPN